MVNLTKPASILLVNTGGVVGNLLTSVSIQELPPHIKLVDVVTFLQLLDISPFEEFGHTSIIVIDMPDGYESKSVKRKIKSNPALLNTPIVDIQTSSGADHDQLVEVIHKINERQHNLPPAITNAVDGKEMRLIPAGSYKRRSGISPDYSMVRGSQKTESYTNALYMDKHPVSRLEYQAFIDQTSYMPSTRWDKDFALHGLEKHPAVGITWQDVIAYARWTGKRFATPDEWEKAAFGINGSLFPWGDEYRPNLCNILESNIGGTTPEGANSPQGDSPYGICDLFGNVWEWVYDWTASSDSRMLMGGAWDTPLEYLLAPYYARVRANPGLAGENFGFRLVVSLDYRIAADAVSKNNQEV